MLGNLADFHYFCRRKRQGMVAEMEVEMTSDMKKMATRSLSVTFSE